MRYTAEDIKDFLWSYTILKGIEKDRYISYLETKDSALKTTTALTGMPHGGGMDRASMLAGLIDKQADWTTWNDIAAHRKVEIVELIVPAPISDMHKTILIHRYIYREKWTEVKETIDAMYESTLLRQVYREHNKALLALAEWANSSEEAKKILNGYFRHE